MVVFVDAVSVLNIGFIVFLVTFHVGNLRGAGNMYMCMSYPVQFWCLKNILCHIMY